MAKRRPLSADPMVRAAIRQGIRSGLSVSQITADVLQRFPAATQGATSRIITQEQRRQSAVDRLMAKDFRFRANLHALVGCGKGEKVRARLTVTWADPQTGHTRTFGQSLMMGNTGTYGDIINTALQSVIQDAQGRGYVVPTLNSQNTSGRNFYRFEYLDCV